MESEHTGIVHHSPAHSQRKGYSTLYGRFVLLTLICSVVPLLLVGWGIYEYYSRFSSDRMVENFQLQAQHHQKLIELFLKERASDLELIAFSHSLAYLSQQPNLHKIFTIMNRDGAYFEDLGVISDSGFHISYEGPYNLMGIDYSRTFWFKALAEKDVYISDIFLGFRNVPHFIIALAVHEGDRKWILRATVSAESFRALVEDVKMGETGEVYLVNREGILQTTPRFGGAILGKTPLPMELFTEQSGVLVLEPGLRGTDTRPRQVVAYTWLNGPRWMLVVKQDYAEVNRLVNHANHAMLVFLHVSILAILIVSVITTRHMIQAVKKRDEEKDALNRQLVQASKLASVGELAAGVAHEINNPLAIILTGNQVIRDFADECRDMDGNFRAQLLEFLEQTDSQVLRCNMITHNLLRFARRTKSVVEEVDLNKNVSEVIELMEKRAKSSGVGFQKELDPDLPPFLSDPSQLQQVFVNLVSNAIDAHEGKPYGTIRVLTRRNEGRRGVEVLIGDTGMGISADNLERIFDPFFTTKPVGKGTGLGLSISYSIIKNLRGDIDVRSTVGQGTEFTIFLPFLSSKDLQDSLYERKVSK